VREKCPKTGRVINKPDECAGCKYLVVTVPAGWMCTYGRKKGGFRRMKCANCGRDLDRYPALYPNQKCPTLVEIIKDMLGIHTRWKQYRRVLNEGV